jgi:hypothetical protein
MKWLLCIFVLFLFLLSCNTKEDSFFETEPEPEQDLEIIDSVYAGLNMYYLENKELTSYDVFDTNLTELELENEPFVSQGNIKYYDCSTHAIHLFEEVALPGMNLSVLGKPFVVVTDSIRHYLGAIWPMYSSANNTVPIIDDSPRFYPNDIIKISMGRSTGPDTRLNDTIIQTLKDYDVFHAGISFTIDSIAILENDSVNNNCTISYTIKIVNNDDLNLYVFDPTKMIDIFYYFHNSLYFKNDDKYYESKNGGKKPADGVDNLNWLTKINSNDSIKWTLQKTGYPYIPRGNYKYSFTFSGLNSVEKSVRERPDGLVWVGKLTASDSIDIN